MRPVLFIICTVLIASCSSSQRLAQQEMKTYGSVGAPMIPFLKRCKSNMIFYWYLRKTIRAGPEQRSTAYWLKKIKNGMAIIMKLIIPGLGLNLQ